jgi:flagellin-like protein
MRQDGAAGAGGRPPDGRGQSETIGVVLLVAVVIVLAAGVGQPVSGPTIAQAGE